MFRITILPRRILAAAVIVTVAVVLLTYGPFHGRSSGDSQAAVSPGTRLEVEVITLRPFGFEPSELTRPKGPFVLFIDDRSGKQSSSLVLQPAAGDRLRAVSLNRKKSEWNDVMDLAPGTYLMQDASNPELRCQITILP